MNIWKRLGNFLGFSRPSKYTRENLIDANLRTSIYMAAIIMALEVVMIVRRIAEFFVDPSTHALNFHNTFSFALLLSVGLAMLVYGASSVRLKRSPKSQSVLNIVFSLPALVLGLLLPIETFSSSPLKNGLMISFYLGTAAFGLTIIVVSIVSWAKNARFYFAPVLVVTLFALVCLIFGIRVGYSDYTDPTGHDVFASKEIMAFLMMAVYVGCLVIWRPFISLGILGIAFLLFYWVLSTVDPAFRSFPEGDLINYVTFFISVVTVAFSIYHQRVRVAKSSEELETLATTDTLTGLSSFDHFISLVGEQTRGSPDAINKKVYLFVNVLNFRVYNDHYGFAEGNLLLKRVGGILAHVFPKALICRVSDDRFALFADEEGHFESFLRAQKEVAELAPGVLLSLRAGCYVHHLATEDPHRAVDKARYACVEGKKTPHRYSVYDKKMHDSYHLMQYIIRNLDRAIEEEHIKVYFQPLVDAKSGKVVSCEALARWQDPRYGFLSPGAFIPILENAQVIHRLDAAMLRAICRDLRNRMDAGLPVVPCSLNLSRLDFSLTDVVAMVEAATKEYGVSHSYLHFEITESALAKDTGPMVETIHALKEKGFEFWIDDFGAGYSSFNALKELDFDVLKIDMSMLRGFHENPKTKSLLRFLIDMASSLGLRTVCEGVEDKEIAVFLAKEGCGMLQGYLYGKAIPFEEIDSWNL